MRRHSLLAQRHIATQRAMRDGAARTWDRRRYGGMLHYRLLDRTRIPERNAACSFGLDVPRHQIAATLRIVRAKMRE